METFDTIGELRFWRGARFVGREEPKCCVEGCGCEATYSRRFPDSGFWAHYCDEHWKPLRDAEPISRCVE